jgi:predicted transcriptional regulator
MYLGGMPTSEIAEALGVTRQNVEYHLNNQKSDFSFRMMELTENMALINVGRLEFALKQIWPAVANGDLRAIKALTDITKLEIEWAKTIRPQQDNSEAITIEVEKFEQTITGNSPHYATALENLQEDWMSGETIQLEDIYAASPIKLPSEGGMASRIEAVEKQLEKLDLSNDEDT